MGLMPLAVVLGLAVGWLTGGRARHLGDRTFRLWPALLVGAVLQLAAELGALGAAGHWLIVVSYGVLSGFVVANLRLAGMGVILVGILMNVATIAANAGMPVDERAIVAAGLADDVAAIDEIDFRAKRHRMTGDDTLYWLSDIVPVRLLGTGQVLSFGDLVMCAGVASLLANLLHPFPRRRGRAGWARLEAADEDRDAGDDPTADVAVAADDRPAWPFQASDERPVDLRTGVPLAAGAGAMRSRRG